MPSVSQSLFRCAVAVVLLLALWGGVVEAKGPRSHPKRHGLPCRREAAALCTNATTRATRLQCLEQNHRHLKEGRCRNFIIGLTSCRADLLAASAQQDVTVGAEASQNTSSLACASESVSGSVKTVAHCLREWNADRTLYGEDLLTTNCTGTTFFARATKKHGGHRKRRGSISGSKAEVNVCKLSQ